MPQYVCTQSAPQAECIWLAAPGHLRTRMADFDLHLASSCPLWMTQHLIIEVNLQDITPGALTQHAMTQ